MAPAGSLRLLQDAWRAITTACGVAVGLHALLHDIFVGLPALLHDIFMGLQQPSHELATGLQTLLWGGRHC